MNDSFFEQLRTCTYEDLWKKTTLLEDEQSSRKRTEKMISIRNLAELYRINSD